jgi:hypothetical protein
MTTATTDPTRPTPATAVLVLGGATREAALPVVRRFLESLDRSRHYPTVLADAELERDASELLDGLRDDGVPVMVSRPLARRRGVASIPGLLELTFYLRSADAKVVHIAAGDAHLARMVKRARRFVRGLETVIEVPAGPRARVGGGSR